MPPLTQDFSFASSYGLLQSSSQTAQNSTSNPTQGVRRMTIRQLLRARKMDDDSDAFILEEHVFKRVLLMANVYESSADASTKIKYGLDDGTGRIQGNRWPLEEGEPSIGFFGYARVYGELESWRGRKSVKILNIRPVLEPGDEVFYHFLHAMYDTVVCDKGLPGPQDYTYRHVETAAPSRRLNNVPPSTPQPPRNITASAPAEKPAPPLHYLDTDSDSEVEYLGSGFTHVSISDATTPRKAVGGTTSSTASTSYSASVSSASSEVEYIGTSLNNMSVSTDRSRGNATASTSAAPSAPPRANPGAPGPDQYLALPPTARAILQLVDNQELDMDEELGAPAEDLLPDVVRMFPDMTADVFNTIMDSLINAGFIRINEVNDCIYFKRVLD